MCFIQACPADYLKLAPPRRRVALLSTPMASSRHAPECLRLPPTSVGRDARPVPLWQCQPDQGSQGPLVLRACHANPTDSTRIIDPCQSSPPACCLHPVNPFTEQSVHRAIRSQSNPFTENGRASGFRPVGYLSSGRVSPLVLPAPGARTPADSPGYRLPRSPKS